MFTLRNLRRALALATTGVVVAAGLAVLTPTAASAAVPPTPAPLQERNGDVITADPLPAPQIENGFVWSQVTIGNVVYAAGKFLNVRPAGAAPGTSLIPRSNILAFDITTGELLPFAPAVNGTIRSLAASPDGSRLYIGGSFNKIGNDTRWNFAAVDPTTGAPIAGFAPSVGGTAVHGIAATADTVYVDGLFTQANGIARKNFAAFATNNGALRDWAPVSDLQADALVMEPGNARVIAAGRFSTINNVTQRGLVALDPITGAIDTGWLAPQTIVNGINTGPYAGKAGIFTLSTDATGIYGTGWSYAPWTAGNVEGVFAADAGTGAVRWVADCHGDHYGVYSTGKTVYATSHTHACETTGLHPELSPRQFKYLEAFTAEPLGTLPRSQSAGSLYKDWSGTPSPGAYTVAPDFTVGTTSGLGQAGLSITGAGSFISVAGEFTSVNNQQYQGIVRFATAPAAGAKQGPRLSGTAWATPTAQSTLPGNVQVSAQTNWDRDNRDLTYELLRDGTSAPVATVTKESFWWTRTGVKLVDATATPGTTPTYRVRAKDANGNAVTSAPVSVTVAAGTPLPYANAVVGDGASLYYPMGSIRQDWAGTDQPIFGSGVTTTSPGAVKGASTDASTFPGTSSSLTSSTNAVNGPNTFSQELWFKTNTDRGGKLIGFGDSRTGNSGWHDRHIYMRNDGRLTFGVYPNAVKTVSSVDAYNDDKWHHVVSTTGANGIALYVDGVLVGSDSSATAGAAYWGYWRIGGDAFGGWPNASTSQWFAGSIDEVAIYPTALSATQVATHFALGDTRVPPVPAFTASVADLSAQFDGSASSTPSGTITDYSWNFGDGSPVASGITSSHTYTAAGTYAVTLTVKDSRGVTATKTQDVVVTAANTAPVSSFKTTVNGLTVAADGTGSSDVDGAIAEHRWNWGDGSAESTGATASHSYAAPGMYQVSLTVKDAAGATATTTAQVSVTAPPIPSFFASDDFARTATGGWGSADIGGAWTVAGGAASAVSVSDGKGRVSVAPGSTRNMLLNGSTARDVLISADFSLSTAPSEGSTYVGFLARSSGADNYTVRSWMHVNGSVWIVIQRGSTVLKSYTVPGITRAPGDSFSMTVRVAGGASTTIDAKLWRAGTPEPANWQVTATDATGLDVAGAAGVHVNRSGAATTTGLVAVDGFRVTKLG